MFTAQNWDKTSSISNIYSLNAVNLIIKYVKIIIVGFFSGFLPKKWNTVFVDCSTETMISQLEFLKCKNKVCRHDLDLPAARQRAAHKGWIVVKK